MTKENILLRLQQVSHAQSKYFRSKPPIPTLIYHQLDHTELYHAREGEAGHQLGIVTGYPRVFRISFVFDK